MKIKTQDLIGAPLDWAVAKGQDILKSSEDLDGYVTEYAPIGFRPSTSGDTVIEIMEREGISAMTASGHKGGRKWAAWQGDPPVLASEEITGPTLRIAVCRAFVAAKLGDEVDVPEELMK